MKINDDVYELGDKDLDELRTLLTNAFASKGGVWLNVSLSNVSDAGTRAVWVSPAHNIEIQYDEVQTYDAPSIGTPPE